MKKTLALLLALMTLLSFAACSKPNETDDESNDATQNETDTRGETESDTQDGTESDTDTESDTNTESDTEQLPVDSTFVDRDETVYVVGVNALYVRSAPEIVNGNTVGSLAEGDSVKRIGYSESWSKIIYKEQEYYASSKYLSIKAPLEFDDIRETAYVKVNGKVTVRSKAWADSDPLTYLTDGTMVIRTGVSKDTDEFGSSWSRVDYTDDKGNAKTGYINSAFLTTEEPLAFEPVNETVTITNCVTVAFRATPSTSGSELAVLSAGTEVKRIGIAKTLDGKILWSKVEYDGKVGYVSSEYLVAKVASKTFYDAGMYIVLNEDFEAASTADAAAMGCTAVFASEDIMILVTKTLSAEIAAQLGGNASAEDYANAIITGSQLGTTVQKVGDLVCFTYNIISGEDIVTVFAATYKSMDSYWAIQFMTEATMFPALKANILTYADSVYFK